MHFVALNQGRCSVSYWPCGKALTCISDGVIFEPERIDKCMEGGGLPVRSACPYPYQRVQTLHLIEEDTTGPDRGQSMAPERYGRGLDKGPPGGRRQGGGEDTLLSLEDAQDLFSDDVNGNDDNGQDNDLARELPGPRGRECMVLQPRCD